MNANHENFQTMAKQVKVIRKPAHDNPIRVFDHFLFANYSL